MTTSTTSTHRALLLTSRNHPPTLTSLPTPTVTTTPGSALVTLLAIPILPYTLDVLLATRPYPLTLPLVPGHSAIGRIHSVGPDATTLAPGQLVLVDILIRARDAPNTATILHGFHGGQVENGARKLMDGEWRHGTFAEVVKTPLENCYVLDEQRLMGTAAAAGMGVGVDVGVGVGGCLGYGVEELAEIGGCLVAYGGMAGIVKPGDTVIVAPATGRFGGAAVRVAKALGARVVACGRSAEKLATLKAQGIETCVIQGSTTTTSTGEEKEEEKEEEEIGAGLRKVLGPRGADVYIDFSPPEAAGSAHIAACLAALKVGGTAALMGGIQSGIELSYSLIMYRSLTVRGKFMYTREEAMQCIKLIENGNLRLGKEGGFEVVGTYGLEQAEEALRRAAGLPGGSMVVLKP